MQNNTKEWLVRTRTGEILGPFTQRELLEELKKHTFSTEDEIAQSHQGWISAQSLTHREVEEFTQTHTRNQTVTKSMATNSQVSAAAALNENTTTPTSPVEIAQPHYDEFTPTPTDTTKGYRENPFPRSAPPMAPHWDKNPSRFAPLVVSAVVVGGLWFMVASLKPRNRPDMPPPPLSGGQSTSTTESESPFVRQIYGLIHAGESQNALKQLTQYHEKNHSKGDLEYLVPYAALLITEGDSPSRARKFLEQVLGSGQASPQLKSRAHHWLGYLMLSESDGDSGESHFLEALQLNPKDPAARFNLGRAYLKQQKLSQALDYLNLAELEVPDLWLVHLYKGRTKAAMGNVEEARAAFKKAIDTSPDRWITYLYYSLYLSAIKENASAQLSMKKMLTRDPQYESNSPRPWGFFEEEISYAEYLETFETIMGKVISEEKEIGRLYISYLMSGSSSEEIKRIEAVAERGGLMAKVLALKVALDRDAPLDTIKTALQRLPQHMKEFGYYAYVLRGDAHTRLGMFNEAQQDLQTALLLEPQSAVARWAYAVLLKKTGKESEAQNEIKGLLSYHPNYIPAIVSSHNF